ncbi:hypothetical protein JCM19232_1080 [Vibrio ishigakensis]|uniref:Uncharacterized protein n=1 Tax=Vibrio ishigakensis TaxID=1481914 RepID=A0A0B8PC76_9VIBR|nr:hypothetical protein JCM19232_1080 [Vibrio ishigakensis]
MVGMVLVPSLRNSFLPQSRSSPAIAREREAIEVPAFLADSLKLSPS